MRKFSALLVLACWFLFADANADEAPAKGMFLVATEEVGGPYFAKTVILLLHHDETGSLGLVVNRPIDVESMESLELRKELRGFSTSFFWGGPVSQSSMHALMRTELPPQNSQHIVDSVYVVDIDENLLASEADASTLRFFAGYAGWKAGQLQYELATNSWLVIPATEALVFAEDAAGIWQRLINRREYRAGIFGSTDFR